MSSRLPGVDIWPQTFPSTTKWALTGSRLADIFFSFVLVIFVLVTEFLFSWSRFSQKMRALDHNYDLKFSATKLTLTSITDIIQFEIFAAQKDIEPVSLCIFLVLAIQRHWSDLQTPESKTTVQGHLSCVCVTGQLNTQQTHSSVLAAGGTSGTKQMTSSVLG